MVGDSDAGAHAPFESDPQVVFAEIDEVGAELIDTLKPQVVISPLLAHSFDCIDLALILHTLGYRGAYRAMSPLLPSPEVIRREIMSLCPGLSFDLIFVHDPAEFTG